ncbi:MAG: NUDIX domain-containing protein [Candidatus Micrarchaeales archaeon]
MNDEILDVVDPDDMVVSKAARTEVYDRGLMHRIVHVFVISKNNQVYLQKRAETVSYMPGCWCTSAGGHVLSGEDYEQAAKRELDEELGIKTDKLFKIGEKFIYTINNQDRFIQIFALFTPVMPKDSEEVSGGKFLSIEEIIELVNKDENIHPQLPPCFDVLLNNQDYVKEILEKQ